ncbi:disulfide bond formation protein B [Tropicibacter alexandrii]|uniref:disulfide bond formation protein B n=1 Tax=Tropicibacter alexandrii TaxID=2267683 RepID=UPI000EF52D31|nr:disulfide bond formation protein B [Tropicibacter alexandrii]
MTLTRRLYIALAAAGSAALLLGALGFQFIGDMPPCKMCYWQRYGHVASMVAGAVGLLIPIRLIIGLGGLGALSSMIVAIYHSGVERGVFEGPDTCTSNPIGNLSVDDLIAQIEAAPLVRCDEIPWELFGLSMANYNVFASALLVILWILALRTR